MVNALSGFATIWLVVGLGWVLARGGIVDASVQRMMSKISFLVALPALMFSLMSTRPLDRLFTHTLSVSILAIVIAIVMYLIANRLFFRRAIAPATVGAMCACYTNAGNLGLPIAHHLLGDMTWVAPILLIQGGVMQPIALAILGISQSRESGEKISMGHYFTLPFRNPITMGIVAGLLVNVAGLHLPEWLASAVSMVGDMAVPMMLLAFGISLRVEPMQSRGPHVAELWTIQLIKVILMPLVAFLLGHFVFHLNASDTFAVTVIAALPQAQNVFVIADRYRTAQILARDALFWSIFLTVGAILLITALIGV